MPATNKSQLRKLDPIIGKWINKGWTVPSGEEAPMGEVHRYGTAAFCDGTDPDGNVFQITTR